MLEIVRDIEQGTPEWHRVRMGRPTSSMFAAILANGKGGAESKTRRKYLLTLAGEVICGEPAESYENDFMRRGKEMEPEARDLYAMAYGITAHQVGFIKDDELASGVGCSPDSLIGEDGMLEIKTKAADILIDLILRDAIPPEHRAQLQGNLWVARRQWIDLCCYWPGLPLYVKRIERDEGFIAELAEAVAKFNAELYETVMKVRAYGEPTPVEPDTSGSLLMAG